MGIFFDDARNHQTEDILIIDQGDSEWILVNTIKITSAWPEYCEQLAKSTAIEILTALYKHKSKTIALYVLWITNEQAKNYLNISTDFISGLYTVNAAVTQDIIVRFSNSLSVKPNVVTLYERTSCTLYISISGWISRLRPDALA